LFSDWCFSPVSCVIVVAVRVGHGEVVTPSRDRYEENLYFSTRKRQGGYYIATLCS